MTCIYRGKLLGERKKCCGKVVRLWECTYKTDAIVNDKTCKKCKYKNEDENAETALVDDSDKQAQG